MNQKPAEQHWAYLRCVQQSSLVPPRARTLAVCVWWDSKDTGKVSCRAYPVVAFHHTLATTYRKKSEYHSTYFENDRAAAPHEELIRDGWELWGWMQPHFDFMILTSDFASPGSSMHSFQDFRACFLFYRWRVIEPHWPAFLDRERIPAIVKSIMEEHGNCDSHYEIPVPSLIYHPEKAEAAGAQAPGPGPDERR